MISLLKEDHGLTAALTVSVSSFLASDMTDQCVGHQIIKMQPLLTSEANCFTVSYCSSGKLSHDLKGRLLRASDASRSKGSWKEGFRTLLQKPIHLPAGRKEVFLRSSTVHNAGFNSMTLIND